MEDNEDIILSRDRISADQLYIPETITQDAKLELPKDFLIRTPSNIRQLEEFIAHNYRNSIIFYRGHESKEYELKSTIMRLVKDGKNLPVQEVVEAERQALSTFKQTIFKSEWEKHKPSNTDLDLFMMSIGRHLGLSCRLIDVTASLRIAVWFAVMSPTHYDKDGELLVIICDKDKISKTYDSPFLVKNIVYAQEPFVSDNLNDLPSGELRRYIQHGRFLFVDNESLLDEQNVIEEHATVLHYTIPWNYKLSLAQSLYKDVYSGIVYQAEIDKINREISGQLNQ
jgi:hypothetical protein